MSPALDHALPNWPLLREEGAKKGEGEGPRWGSQETWRHTLGELPSFHDHQVVPAQQVSTTPAAKSASTMKCGLCSYISKSSSGGPS